MGELFQLVLVDDKKDLVQGIAAAVDWKAKGVEVSCFYNGRDALEFILANHPDMVITDIRMPFLDGLELAKEVSKVYSDVRFIILTGYDDFSYARDALRLGVVEYLSKPVRIQDIEELVTKEMELSRQKKLEQMGRETLRKQYKKGLPALRAQWFSDFLKKNKPVTESELTEKFRELDMHLSPENFMVAVLELDLTEYEQASETDEEYSLIQYAAENIGTELLEKSYPCEVLRYGQYRTVFLMNYNDRMNQIVSHYELYQLFSKLQGMMEDYFKTTVSIGIGGRYPDIPGIAVSYKQAVTALEQTFYSGPNSIISILDMAGERKEDKTECPDIYLNSLIEEIKKGNTEEAAACLHRIFAVLKKKNTEKQEVVREKIVHYLLRLCQECKHGEETRLSGLLSELERRKTLVGIERWMEGFVTYLSNWTKTQEQSDIMKNIMKVKEYIDLNYADAISLKKMSDYVYISQSYLSFSFKEIVGINFNDYVTQVRMEHAKELLLHSNYKVYEICEMVGYKDKKYFSDLFKKYTGMLPKEWSRKDNR